MPFPQDPSRNPPRKCFRELVRSRLAPREGRLSQSGRDLEGLSYAGSGRNPETLGGSGAQVKANLCRQLLEFSVLDLNIHNDGSRSTFYGRCRVQKWGSNMFNMFLTTGSWPSPRPWGTWTRQAIWQPQKLRMQRRPVFLRWGSDFRIPKSKNQVL